jgi:hypothetical protein
MEAAFESVSITLEGLFTARVFVAIVFSPFMFSVLAQPGCPAHFKADLHTSGVLGTRSSWSMRYR